MDAVQSPTHATKWKVKKHRNFARDAENTISGQQVFVGEGKVGPLVPKLLRKLRSGSRLILSLLIDC
jgi:hypothetical protein